MDWFEEVITTIGGDVSSNSTSMGWNATNSTEFSTDLPVWRQIMWTILCASISVVGTVGNAIVIWIVLGHKRMRTVTNLFIVNLAIADGLVALLNVTFTSYSLIYNTWPFGRVYCKISELIATMSITISVLTLSAIAIDRYIAIMNPFQKRFGKRKTIIATIGIWIVSLVVSCPNWVFVTTTKAYYVGNTKGMEERILCHGQWPDTPFGAIQERMYTILFMAITYFLPLGCMTFTYTRIGEKLWGASSIGERTQGQLENIQAKRKIVKMLIVVVIIFAVCWLPFQLYFIVTTTSPDTVWHSYKDEIYIACFWLAMSNSMYNPIIYCWMNAKFHDGFKKVFRWCPWVKYTPENALNDRLLNITRTTQID